jgi:hypothetical protein
MYGGELLKRLHTPELPHGPLSSWERLVGILTSVVEPASGILLCGMTECFHRRQADDIGWKTMTAEGNITHPTTLCRFSVSECWQI